MLFLPDYLREAFAKAEIIDAQGQHRPMVSKTHVIEAAEPDELEKDLWDLLSPLRLGWLIFAITNVITLLGRFQKQAYKGHTAVRIGRIGGLCTLFLGLFLRPSLYMAQLFPALATPFPPGGRDFVLH